MQHTGGLSSAPRGQLPTIELDMLDPNLVAANPQHINNVKAEARGVEAPIVEEDEFTFI